MTCQEQNGPGGPCRTVVVVFGGAPATGRKYTAVAKASPAAGEAVVRYQESVDCTAPTTNGWVEGQAGGDFTVDVYGDTGINFDHRRRRARSRTRRFGRYEPERDGLVHPRGQRHFLVPLPVTSRHRRELT